MHIRSALAMGLISLVAATSGLSAAGTPEAREALDDDAAAAAIALDTQTEAVLRYSEGQDEFARQAAEIEERWPDSFVSAEWQGAGALGTRVMVRPGALEAISGYYPALRLQEVDAMTAAQREDTEFRAVEALAAAQPENSVSVSIDPQSNRALVTRAVDEGAMQRSTASAAVQVPSEVARELLASGVTEIDVAVVRAQASRVEFGSGGNWGSTCTAGFTAKRAGSPAITTTVHCGGRSTYDGASLSARKATSRVEGDVMSYVASGGSLTNSLRYDWGKHRAIKRVGDPVIGNVVCHFGISTGHSCAEVVKVKQSQYFSDLGYTVGGLVFVDQDISKSGDSGGPWFWSDKAHGIHMGKCGGVSCFTRIGALASIGTTVYVG